MLDTNNLHLLKFNLANYFANENLYKWLFCWVISNDSTQGEMAVFVKM